MVQTTKSIVATCNLNQWALDFDGNLKRTIDSIRIAKEKGARFRLGPELELSGYSCEDHFLEMDTFFHCEQSLAKILETDITDSILCEIGCPILHNGVRYNCRIFCLDRQILLIRPKMSLADDGNYREPRYFSTWKNIDADLQEHPLSTLLSEVTKQTSCPFGFAVLKAHGATIGAECCEELWTLLNPHIPMCLSGVEIITNGSGSHHQLRKLHSRVELIQAASRRGGGAYLFANQKGGDGGRLYFDGCCLICVNGELVAQGSQFSVLDVEVVTATINIQDVHVHRQGGKAFQEQCSQQQMKPLPTIDISSRFSLLVSDDKTQGIHSALCQCQRCRVTPVLSSIRYHTPEEECVLGPACWLWDYLRRSNANGFLVPLSGGADSASVAAIVHVMSHLVLQAVKDGDALVTEDLKRIIGLSDLDVSFSTAAITRSILHTVYMGTANSTSATRDRAAHLASEISSYHQAFSIDTVVSSVVSLFSAVCGETPRFVSQGGTMTEDLALQNIQARLRMVLAYLCAQLFPWIRGHKGFLLVLGTGNVDEALRGYMTKYDCSSADINPIGGIAKGDLKKMLIFVSEKFQAPSLRLIAEATPTAELRPVAENSEEEEHSQVDEVEMGMSYSELGVFGFLRKSLKCGPVSMFLKLSTMWGHLLNLSEIAVKVKRFFYFYSVNRHKCTTLTPSYHAENYSPDDNRFDLRPFLYNTRWSRQFDTIDQLLEGEEQKGSGSTGAK